MDGHEDAITAKNEAGLFFNDPNETLPTQYSPSVPIAELSAPPSPGGRRESTFSPTASETQLAAMKLNLIYFSAGSSSFTLI